MKHFLILIIASLPAFGSAVCKATDDTTANGTWSGSTCTGASRPVHYIVSNDGETTANLRAMIQAVVDDAWRGDTIKFTAGQTFVVTGNPSSIQLHKPHGSSGYVTLTTTEDAKLPASGTRITPAYKPLMPYFRADHASNIFQLTHGPSQADHYKFRGLYFDTGASWAGTSQAFGYINVGTSGTYDSTDLVFRPASINWDTTTNGSAASGQKVVPVTDATNLTAGVKLVFSTQDADPVYEIASVDTTTPGAHTITMTANLSSTISSGTKIFALLPDMAAPDRTIGMPDDIVVQHCVMMNSNHSYISRLMVISSVKTITIRDNFFSHPINWGNSDSQVIGGTNPYGPITIENNFIDGGSENMMPGGSYSFTDSAFDSMLIRYNYFPHPLERDQVEVWSMLDPTSGYNIPSEMSVPGLTLSPRLVFKGRGLRESSAYWTALNTGVVGTTIPDFASVTGTNSIYDYDATRVSNGTTMRSTTECGGTQPGDGVCWQRTPTTRVLIKNNFELKSGKNITVQYNVFSGFGPGHTWNGAQYTMINIKSSTQGTCDSGETFPTCNRPEVTNITFANNVMRNIYAGGILLGGASVEQSVAGGYVFRGNLATFHRPPNASETTATAAALYKPLLMFEGNGNNTPARIIPMDGLTVDNNTFYTEYTWHDFPMAHGGSRGSYTDLSATATSGQRVVPCVSVARVPVGAKVAFSSSLSAVQYTVVSIDSGANTVTVERDLEASYVPSSTVKLYAIPGGFTGTRSMSDNIWARGVNGANGVSTTTADDGVNSLPIFPNTATGGTWGKQIILGAPTADYPASTVWTGCGSASACSGSSGSAIDWSAVFRNASRSDFRLLNTHTLKRSASNGNDIGADPAQLPMIKDLTVVASDREVLFRYALTPVIADIPCAVELNTSPDFESPGTYVAELSSSNISTYYGQDSDYADRFPRPGARRVISLGYASNLSASTYYHYRLHCGGDTRRGSFSTGATVAGTTSVKFPQGSATNLTWGYTYSRSGDSLSGGGTVACSGSTCTPTVTRGRVIYYRYDSGPVRSMLVQ